MTPMTIDVVSDVMCPWCYIGKRRLDAALAMRGDIAFDVRWRAFKLDPTIPKGGIDRETYLSNKFGGPERAAGVYARIAEAGEAEGLAFNFPAIRRSPNTTDAHRLIRWSYGQKVQDAVVEGLFKAFFMDGADIEDHETLGDIAGDAGMDAALVREVLDSDADVATIEQELSLAKEMGIDGVPCFIIGARVAVMGAQEPDVLLSAIEKAEATADLEPERPTD